MLAVAPLRAPVWLAFARTVLLLALSAGAAIAADGQPGLAATPLAPKSGPRGATMFTLMPPEQTGIVTSNPYDDPRMWGDRYQEFVYGSSGTGVAIGDYDGDGRPDIAVASKTGGCRLFRNLGGWKFEDVTEKAGLAASDGDWTEKAKSWIGLGGAKSLPWTQGVTFADVNNDGRLDLYVCRSGAPNLLYINQGDGTFKEEAAARGLAVNDASAMAAFCDYDRDGWLDVYVLTNLLDAQAHPVGQRDYLFHNNGDGTFTDVTDRAGITGEAQGHSATWWDYDNDGWPDLYVANDFAPSDKLYHNNRDGTFTDVLDRVVPHTPHSAMGADLGDVNNDGLIDFLVADMATTTHEKDERGMARIRSLLTDPPPDSTTAPQYMRSALYVNTGTGRMLEAACLTGLSATDWTWGPRLEDLDNDGRLDAFFTNGMVRELHNVDLVQRISAADTLADGVRLMKSSPPLAEENLAFRNLGNLQFENVSAAWGLNQKGVSFGAAFGDLDGDGDLDLVYTNYEKGVTVLRNDSDTGHRLIVALRGTRSNRFGVGATVRIETASGVQVRQLVLARGVLSSSEPILHFGLGEDARIDRLTVAWPSGQTQVFTGVAADQKLTITEPDGPPPAPAAAAPPPPAEFTDASRSANFAWPSREEPVIPTREQPLLPWRLDHRGPALATGDLDGDGRDDVVIGGTPADPTRILLASGAGFGAPATLATGDGDDGPLLVFDADGDGANDLLVTKAAGQPVLFLNDGHGHLRPAPEGALPRMTISAGAVAAADFDRDGRLDVFIGGRVIPGKYPQPPRSVLLANRGGRFEDVTDSLAPGMGRIGLVTAALWSDVDGDGWPDLLVAVEWGAVRYFHNRAGRGFDDWTEKAGFAAAGTGWWTSLATADFNGDGRPDFVAGNVGLNTPYHADATHPALLYDGDFAGNGRTQIVEATYESERVYPWRNRQDLAASIPWLMKRYPRNDVFARATVPEIFGAERLAAARRLEATEFRSGVFLSQPDGTYRFAPLPRIAQIAPLQGMVAGDFDGDGRADIYAVQNSYAPIPSVGRFDGGLSQLLRGDGHGHFTPVPPAASGLVVPGDAKALAVVDLDGDGWPDFLVTRNNGTTLAFRNNGAVGHRSLRVELRGPAVNPTAIGARVTLEQADGSRQTSEIGAGSGYYSQSSSACFFGYPEANPPRRVRVRWPSGRETDATAAGGTATLVLTAPRN